MRAKFKVSRSFLLPARSLFVLAGEIVEGEIRSGMNALIPFNRSYSMTCEVEGVEFIKRGDSEEMAITVRYSEPDEGAFLAGLNVADEYLVVSDGPPQLGE